MNGEMNSEAGIKFIEYVRKKEPNMPVMLQSTDEKHAIKAQQIHAVFLNKQSSTLLQDLRKFILNNWLQEGFLAVPANEEDVEYHLNFFPPGVSCGT